MKVKFLFLLFSLHAVGVFGQAAKLSEVVSQIQANVQEVQAQDDTYKQRVKNPSPGVIVLEVDEVDHILLEREDLSPRRRALLLPKLRVQPLGADGADERHLRHDEFGEDEHGELAAELVLPAAVPGLQRHRGEAANQRRGDDELVVPQQDEQDRQDVPQEEAGEHVRPRVPRVVPLRLLR